MLCIMFYYCQCLIDYEISSLNENFLNNEKFLAVVETNTGSRKWYKIQTYLPNSLKIKNLLLVLHGTGMTFLYHLGMLTEKSYNLSE